MILLIFTEFLTGNYLFNKSKIDCVYLQCGQKLVFENVNLHNQKKNYNVIYFRDDFGFRGRKKVLNDIDFLTVGGSTTDERYLKIEDTWSEQLELRLNEIYKDIDVVNAGIDGQSTKGHIWNFEKWFNELENFKPKYIIFYIGITEILYDQSEFDQSFFDNDKKNLRLNFIQKVKYFLNQNNGFIYKIFKKIYKKSIQDTHNVGHNPLRKTNQFIQPSKNILIDVKKKNNFKKNLNLLNEYSLKLDIIPIFITQKTLRGYEKNNKIFSFSDKDFFTYEKNISIMIIEFCKENKIICFDLNKELQFNEADFYDLVHTTPLGSKKIADFIFKNIYFNNKIKIEKF